MHLFGCSCANPGFVSRTSQERIRNPRTTVFAVPVDHTGGRENVPNATEPRHDFRSLQGEEKLLVEELFGSLCSRRGLWRQTACRYLMTAGRYLKANT